MLLLVDVSGYLSQVQYILSPLFGIGPLVHYPMGDFWEPIEDYSIEEGSYRIPGRFWQVFCFAKRDVPELRHRFGVCESGITGIAFDVPNEVVLYRDYQIRAMSRVFDTDPESWIVARGPCSDILIGDGRAGL